MQMNFSKGGSSEAPPLKRGHAHRGQPILPFPSACAGGQDQARPPPPLCISPRRPGQIHIIHFHRSQKSEVMCECAHTWADVPRRVCACVLGESCRGAERVLWQTGASSEPLVLVLSGLRNGHNVLFRGWTGRGVAGKAAPPSISQIP